MDNSLIIFGHSKSDQESSNPILSLNLKPRFYRHKFLMRVSFRKMATYNWNRCLPSTFTTTNTHPNTITIVFMSLGDLLILVATFERLVCQFTYKNGIKWKHYAWKDRFLSVTPETAYKKLWLKRIHTHDWHTHTHEHARYSIIAHHANEMYVEIHCVCVQAV